MELYILNIISLRTSDFAEPGCEHLVKTEVVSFKEETETYKKAVLKKIAAKYVGAHAKDEAFEQEFSTFEGKLMLESTWEYGYQGYELYGFCVELVPCEVKEL